MRRGELGSVRLGTDAAMWVAAGAEPEVEADRESAMMDHAVAKYFQRERTKAAQSYRPASRTSFEQNIGLESHIRRQMPLFLTLRDAEGSGLATAMLPPG